MKNKNVYMMAPEGNLEFFLSCKEDELVRRILEKYTMMLTEKGVKFDKITVVNAVEPNMITLKLTNEEYVNFKIRDMEFTPMPGFNIGVNAKEEKETKKENEEDMNEVRRVEFGGIELGRGKLVGDGHEIKSIYKMQVIIHNEDINSTKYICEDKISIMLNQEIQRMLNGREFIMLSAKTSFNQDKSTADYEFGTPGATSPVAEIHVESIDLTEDDLKLLTPDMDLYSVDVKVPGFVYTYNLTKPEIGVLLQTISVFMSPVTSAPTVDELFDKGKVYTTTTQFPYLEVVLTDEL